jgi:hypothetical protein
MPKFDTESPRRIAATDYNTIRNKIKAILNIGSGQKGYGQTIASSAVFAGNNITKNQWDLLRYDLVNTLVHQDGVLPAIVTLAATDVVGYSAANVNTNYDTLAERSISNRFNIGAGQSIVVSPTLIDSGTSSPTAVLGTQSRTGAWATQSQCTLTVTFTGGYTGTLDGTPWTATPADHARHFFNSGSKIRFTSSRTGGTVSPQNNAWTNLLSTAIGTVNFGANTPSAVNFYTLTTSYQQIYQLASSTPYSANYYAIEALCNCTDATNTNGTASTVTFRITWRDDYTDPGAPAPGDSVDGTLNISIEELRASGLMQPSGTFTVAGPTSYSISPITAS